MEEINQFNYNMVPVLNEVGSVDAHIDSPPPTMRKFMNKQLPINRFRNVNIYQCNRFYCTGFQNFGGSQK
ncbi:hypothetical protein DVH24_005037 [Malus domestica]|uniref:Uncharacterized protein n=1 Tax=Malus domestica TaxID=3750 RepID=A0A498IIR5_MALDO|nr:hypothetical protein DVH24_005037 [Malus domestica]